MLKLDMTGSRPELYLYGMVAKPSWWTDEEIVSADAVLRLLDQLDPGQELVVRINSEGGDVFEGVAIYQALARRQARLEVQVDALAASIASVIAMAGDEIIVAGNAMVMVHQAWTWADGNADELAKISETLHQVDAVILDTYAARAGKKSSREQIEAWMRAETWMGATDAVDRGFADRAAELKTGAVACVRAGRFKNAPASVLASETGKRPGSESQATNLAAISARIAAARRR